MLTEIEVPEEKKTKGKGGRPPEKELNTFGAWVMSCGLTRTQVAEDLEITAVHLGRLMAAEQLPGLELAFRIEEYTKGAITAKSWVKPE